MSSEKEKQYQRREKQYQNRIAHLEFELAQIKKMVFGSKSEKSSPSAPGQTSLFEVEPVEAQPENEQISYERKKPKKQPKREPIAENIPRVETVIMPDNLPEGAKRMGELMCEKLQYQPAKLYVERIVRPKYAAEGKIYVADLPPQFLPQSNCGETLMSFLLISKFVDHLPFHRLVKILNREGYKLSESTISSWFSKTSELLLPLYELMVKMVKESDYVQADETPIRVQDRNKKRKTHRGYHWVYFAIKLRMVVFDYQQGRGREGPAKFIKGFKGILQSDGYAVYDLLHQQNDIVHLACWAHARRKFFEAQDSDKERSLHALKLIGQLYGIEKQIKEEQLGAQEALELRKQSAAILEQIKNWCQAELNNVLPKSPMGKAISYTLGQWKKLKGYATIADSSIDNNLVENAIRPVAIGRKNYLFAGSHKAAQYAAMMYSFLGTCQQSGVNPEKWLTHVLANIQDTKMSELHTLLPQNFQQ